MSNISILRRKSAPYLKFIKIFFVICFIGLIIFSLYWGIKKIFRSLSPFSALSNPASVLKNIDGRTNILILGKGNQEHEAADLTDTMIIISIRLSDKKVSLISLPRDIWIDSMKAKINTAYHYGEQKNPPAGGFALTKDAVYQVTGLPVHYAVMVDFDGFIKAIDLVGGIDIEVKKSFTDEKYPLEATSQSESQYQTVKFEAGLQHMDGDTALKYSRSRYSADPEEGTDFARARRQQQVLLALAKKLKTKETILNLDRARELRKIFDDYTETDLGDHELLALGRIGIGVSLDQIQTIVIDEGTKENPGLLLNPPLSRYGQWVLVPRSGSWQSVQNYIKQELGF